MLTLECLRRAQDQAVWSQCLVIDSRPVWSGVSVEKSWKIKRIEGLDSKLEAPHPSKLETWYAHVPLHPNTKIVAGGAQVLVYWQNHTIWPPHGVHSLTSCCSSCESYSYMCIFKVLQRLPHFIKV
jgi:hypothetical protein